MTPEQSEIAARHLCKLRGIDQEKERTIFPRIGKGREERMQAIRDHAFHRHAQEALLSQQTGIPQRRKP